MKINIPSQLCDSALLAEVQHLARCEQGATALLIAHLAELDARKLYLGVGCSSLFTYCCEILRLSEAEAYNRIEAARAVQKFPVLLDLLSEASLNLTTLRLLAPQLTNENHQELLAAGSGRSRREVEELLAARFPRPDVPSSLRKLPAPRPKQLPALPIPDGEASAPIPVLAPEAPPPTTVPPGPVAPPPPTRRPLVTPLAVDRYAIQFTVNTETRDKLRLAQDLLRHAIPTGDAAEIFDRALTLLLDHLARRKFGATTRPRKDRDLAPDSPAPLEGLMGVTASTRGNSPMKRLVLERVGIGNQ